MGKKSIFKKSHKKPTTFYSNYFKSTVCFRIRSQVSGIKTHIHSNQTTRILTFSCHYTLFLHPVTIFYPFTLVGFQESIISSKFLLFMYHFIRITRLPQISYVLVALNKKTTLSKLGLTHFSLHKNEIVLHKIP